MKLHCLSLVVVLSADAKHRTIDPKHAKNLTIFHVNPMNYSTTPLNMNTADIRGDMYFDLRTHALNLECGIWKNQSFWSRLDCDNSEVTAPDLGITKLVLEVDGRFGSYADCNIGKEYGDDDDGGAGVYECDCHSHSQASCHSAALMHNQTACEDHYTGYGCRWQNQTSVAGQCDVWTCSNSTSAHECQENYGHPGDCGWDEKAGKCEITSTSAPTPAPYGGACNASTVGMEDLRTVDWGQHDQGNNLTQIAAWHDNVMNKVGGLWYSTQEAGFCGRKADPSDPADGYCSWRVFETVARIDKSCSDKIINNAVRSYDAGPDGQNCFQDCSSADVKNQSSICYINCFYATVLGPNANHTLDIKGGMPMDQLEAAWQGGFAEVSEGGCPRV
jgi:hypothetical protein